MKAGHRVSIISVCVCSLTWPRPAPYNLAVLHRRRNSLFPYFGPWTGSAGRIWFDCVSWLIAFPGIKLLGFKDLSELEFEDNIKHSYFIYPDEMVGWHDAILLSGDLTGVCAASSQSYSGSKRTFSALLKSMIKKKKIGLALVLTRRNATPMFCALLPQVRSSSQILFPEVKNSLARNPRWRWVEWAGWHSPHSAPFCGRYEDSTCRYGIQRYL